jgi:hypothetical protein
MPVPILIGTAKPQPTSVAVNSLNLAPKSVYDWCRMMFGGLETTVTAKPAGRRWPTSERYAALFARILGLHRRVPRVGVTVGACSNTRPTLRFYKGIISRRAEVRAILTGFDAPDDDEDTGIGT